MKTLGIFLPTYKRPDALARVAKNIEETTKTPFTLYFGCEPDDKQSIKAAKATGHQCIINQGEQGYSNTIQTIYENSREPFFIHANDDFVFLDAWDAPPMKMMKDDQELMVLGLHDGNPGTNFWTICMIRRKYIEEQSGVVDMPNRLFYPYKHNWQDTEFTATAKKRGVWKHCPATAIEHHHPGFSQWFGETPYDDTYRKNDSFIPEDSQTYESRKHLWESL